MGGRRRRADGAGIEGEVRAAKTVIGFARGRRSQLNFVCTCVAWDAAVLFLSGPGP